MSVDQFPLPPHAYIPGQTVRHDETMFDAIKASCLAETCDATAASNPAWVYGLRLLNEGYYWEAHEVLESVWLAASPNSREKHLVQGVIHLANGALKNAMGRKQAGKRLADLAVQCHQRVFTAVVTQLMGIDTREYSICCRKVALGKTAISIRFRESK